MDHFQRLGLPRRFPLDKAELDRAYLARSRAVHPDFHLAGTEAELHASMELSAALNEAYVTLADPFTRADHLLILAGGPSASEYKQLPTNFLAEMLEAREEVEQARGKPEPVARLDMDFNVRSAAIVRELLQSFDRLESLPESGPERANLMARIRGQLNAAKYVRGLLRDLHFE